jgi:hypothetical protein
MVRQIISVFLSIYILLLSGIPCDDLAVSHSAHQVELSRTSSPACQGDIDHCSPFCTCQCCQACFNISTQPLNFTVIGLGIKYYESKTIFSNPDLFEFLIPPKA